MKNFVDLNETENHEIKRIKIKKEPVTLEEVSIITPKLILSENLDQEEICVIDGDASDYYGNREKDGCFKQENLFSELANEYERAIARQNLGIGDAQTLNWGKIKGNIRNQEDLREYVFNSPQFIGMPTAPTQLITDSSTSIATTEWVVNYISQNGGGGGPSNPPGLQSFIMNPTSGMYGDEPIEVNLRWEYEGNIESQKLNSEFLNNIVREKTLLLRENTSITLEYIIDNQVYQKKASFVFGYPFYYGTSSDYQVLNKTLAKSFNLVINDNEYAYLILPVQDAMLSVNGFVGGFEMIAEQELHGVTYYTYKSANPNLGKLVVNLLN